MSVYLDGKDRGSPGWVFNIVVFSLIALIALFFFSSWQWREGAEADFPAYRQELREKGWAVVDLTTDAFPERFQVRDAAGQDLVVSRRNSYGDEVDVLVFRVPESGEVILRTAGTWGSVFGQWSYIEHQVSVKAGDFFEAPPGKEMTKSRAQDFYAENLHAPHFVAKLGHDAAAFVLSPLFAEAEEDENW